MMRTILIIICTFQLVAGALDPCVNYTLMNYVDKRAVANILDFGNDLSITDNFLDSGWYRIISEAGEDMPTEPPGSFHCGTNYPIWLNGTLPTIVGEHVTEKVCLQSYTDECRLTWDIDIQFCPGNYLVYNLVTSKIISSGYCFGTYVLVGLRTSVKVSTISGTPDRSINNFDPCISHILMKYVDRRAVANILDVGTIPPLTDNYLDTGWYRIISEAGEDMPTNPPGSFHCGTNYPIWLNGTLPTTVGEKVTEKVCLQSYTNICRFTWTIDIKLCVGNYFVYNLVTSEIVSSGYCFGTAAKDVVNTTSSIMTSTDRTTNNFDPCSHYSTIKKSERRAQNTLFKIENGEVPVSDDLLNSGWYRVNRTGCEKMPTSPPGPLHCGTIYPIWLNGDIPSVVGEQISQSVCMQGFTSKCIHSWTIDIKRCTGNFLIYNLAIANTVSSGYCFGTPDTCEDNKFVDIKVNDDDSKIGLIIMIISAVAVCFLIISLLTLHCYKKKYLKKRRSPYKKCTITEYHKWSMFNTTSDSSLENKQTSVTEGQHIYDYICTSDSSLENKQTSVTEGQHIYDYICTKGTESVSDNVEVSSCVRNAKIPSFVRNVPPVHIFTVTKSKDSI